MSTYKRNIVSNFIIQIVKIALGFITSILVARALGPADKGYTSYAILIFGLLGGYGHLGINDATTYFQKKSEYDEKAVYNTNMTYLLIIWTVTSIVIMILKICNVFLNDYNIFFTVFGLAYVLLNLIRTCANSFYIGNEKISEANKYVLMSSILYSVIIIILYLIDYLNAYSYFVLQVIPLMLNVIMLIKNIGMDFNLSIKHHMLKMEFKYGIIIYFSDLFIYLNYRIDQIMIKNMIGDSDLGIYSIAVTLAELLFLVPDSVTSALLGRLYNIDNRADKKQITAATTKYTFYICLILCFAGILMTPLIPIVYGAQYLRAMPVTTILFVGIIFASLARVSCSYFFSEGRPRIHLSITFITLAINIIFNFIFIPRIGINGAAMASAISYTIYGIAYMIFFIKKEGFKLRQFLFIDDWDKKMIQQFFKQVDG